MVSWLIAFGLTLALEVPVYALALRRNFGLLASLALGVGVNVATHPAVWLTYQHFALIRTGPLRGHVLSAPGTFAAVEAAAWLVEAALLLALARTRLQRHRLDRVEAVIIALIANALSAGIGLMLAVR